MRHTNIDERDFRKKSIQTKQFHINAAAAQQLTRSHLDLICKRAKKGDALEISAVLCGDVFW